MSLASISIDLDGIGCYHAIHGLPEPEGRDPIYQVALPRLLEELASLGATATLFAVGQDAEHEEVARQLEVAGAAGHEIANHSHSHDYRLTRRPRATIAEEIARAHAAIERATGAAPRGFRAPGYNVSEAVLDALEAQGYRYDSSIFPSPTYFALRASAIGLYRLRGQPSRSLAGDLRQFAASRFPYRPDRERLFRPGQEGAQRQLVELPIAVLPRLRLPYIGTSLTMLPDVAGRLLTMGLLASHAPINLELHAIDFLDRSDPGVAPALAARQRDLSVPYSVKRRRLGAVFEALNAARELVRLDELAARFLDVD